MQLLVCLILFDVLGSVPWNTIFFFLPIFFGFLFLTKIHVKILAGEIKSDMDWGTCNVGFEPHLDFLIKNIGGPIYRRSLFGSVIID